jgi:hypothetical protein
MIKFTLFLMFFTAAPAPPTDHTAKVWSLQSTSSMEFASKDACFAVGKSITDSLAETATLTVRGWCFCEATGADKCPTSAEMKTMEFNTHHEGVSVEIQTLVPPQSK